MKKRIISLILCIAMCMCIMPFSSLAAQARDTSFEEDLAYSLKSLGLFQGVSDTNFDLDRTPSRTEALVMLIRVLGKESEAQNGSWQHPFTDVAPWADKYVGYAYQNGLTSGISQTQFGSSDTASASMYLTFVLRALGYSDTNGADFTWNNPYTLAANKGILPGFVDTQNFLRADVVTISYAALAATLKGSNTTLAAKLIGAGVFTQAQYDANYNINAIKNHESASSQSSSKQELSSEEIAAKCSSAVFYIEVYDKNGTPYGTGSGFFINSDGTAVTNYHVIENAYSAKIITSDTKTTYNITGVYDYNITQDWAVIKVEGSNFPFLSFGDEKTIVSGAPIYAIGSPLGLDNSFTSGLISNPKRETADGVNLIQISVPLSSGSSGGALINKYGEVIGITSSGITEGQNLNFAVPVSYVQNYSQYSITPLSVLFGSTSSPSSPSYDAGYENGASSQNQSAAYNTLKNWVLSNYTTIDNGKYTYIEYEDNVYDLTACLIMYDIDDGYLYVGSGYYLNNNIFTTAIMLTPSGQSFYGAYSFETPFSKFMGYSTIDAPSFNQDTIIEFMQYEGYTPSISNDMLIASELYMKALLFTDYIFYMYLPQSGYSIEDFGFTNLYN